MVLVIRQIKKVTRKCVFKNKGNGSDNKTNYILNHH